MTYPSQPQFNHSSVQPSYPYQSQMNHHTSYVPQIAYQLPQVSTQLMTELPLVDSGLAVSLPQGSPQPIINLELHRIQETKPLFKMAGSQCNKFKGDKVKVILVLVIRVMLLVPRETLQVDRQGLLNATTVKEAGQILDEEKHAFLADPGVLDGQAVQRIIPNNAAFQTEDLDTYDSDCDDVSNVKVVLMANISNYGSNDFEQTPVVDVTDNEITSDSNIISYS
ncbi:hypothetical protein Tco_0836854 [Tanacetum coccineum]